MIIKKKEFAYSKKTRSQWPFTVPEVAVVSIEMVANEKPLLAFAIVHNWGTYALSGVLESHGFTSLKDSGIWKDDSETGAKKNLTPFFSYVEKRLRDQK